MPRAALAQLLAGLDAGRNLDLMIHPVEPRHLDLAAQRRRGEADRHAAEQRRPVALEHRGA
jgi:hypothetical protein